MRRVQVFLLIPLLAAALGCSLLSQLPPDQPAAAPTNTAAAASAPIATNQPILPAAQATANPATLGCTPRTDWTAYTVQPGDTLGTIAARTGSTITDLSAANCLSDPNAISVGQALLVPRTPDAALPQPSLPQSSGDQETYVSTLGFAFDYPKDWYFSSMPTGGVRVTTYAPDNEPPHPLWTGAIAEVTFGQIPSGGAQPTLEEWANEWRDGLSNAGLQVLSQNAVTLPSGLQAVRYDLVSGSGWEIHDLIFITNGQYIEVTARGDQGLIDSIVNTIRPV